MGVRRRQQPGRSRPGPLTRLCPQCDKKCSGNCYDDDYYSEEDFPVFTRYQKIQKRKTLGMYTRFFDCRGVEWSLLKAKIPPKSEIQRAERILKDEALAERKGCGAVHCRVCKNYNVKANSKDGGNKNIHLSFEGRRSGGNDTDLQHDFFYKHRNELMEKVPNLLKVISTPLPLELVTKFQEQMQGSNQDMDDLLMTFHGTHECNIPSISSKGLIIPGSRGVAVRNGSALGVGIYTSTDFHYSSSYCDSSRMFVCAVLDKSSKRKGGQKDGSTKPVLHSGSAIVVFQEARVIPIFIIDTLNGKVGYSGGVLRWWMTGNLNHSQQVKCSLYEAADNGIKVKRVRVRKEHTKVRREMHKLKWMYEYPIGSENSIVPS